MSTVTLSSLSSASTSELVAYYNERAEKPVKKFADRATAEKRVRPFLEADAATAPKRTLSEAIAASWTRPDVAAARSTRNAVRANGTEYRSVREAFRALRLPIEKHIPFRMSLKAAGKATFETGKKSVSFEIIPAE